MASTDPNVASVRSELSEPPATKATLASVLALVASLVGNVLQWQKGTAELAKTRAEADGLVQQQRENATKSVQSWIEQLQKFDTAEDRVMVLSAAMSTTPYESVKTWAKEQMLRLESDLGRRKVEATQQLAVAITRESGVPSGGQSPGLNPGIGAGPTGPSGLGVGGSPNGPRPPNGNAAPSVRTVELAQLRVSARKTLDRVNVAEAILKTAREAPRGKNQ